MSPIHFHTVSRIHPAPLAWPFSKGLLMERSLSLFLSFCLEDPSCAFGAPLLQGPTHRADSLSFPFILPRGSILRLWRTPFSKGLLMERSSLFFFHSVSRIHPAPLAQSFSKGLLMERSLSLFLLYRFEDPSCAFGAPLLQGPTHGAESLSFPFIPPRGIHPAPLARPFSKGLLMERSLSLFLSFCLEDPSCAFGAPLLQGPTHRADSLSFPFILPRGSILRLWRTPFSKGLLMERSSLFFFHSVSRIHPAPLAQSFSKGLLMEQIHSLFLLYRFEESSCAFGAPLLQGATQLAKLLSFT